MKKIHSNSLPFPDSWGLELKFGLVSQGEPTGSQNIIPQRGAQEGEMSGFQLLQCFPIMKSDSFMKKEMIMIFVILIYYGLNDNDIYIFRLLRT